MKALPVSISVTVCVRIYWGKTRSAAEHPTVTNRSRAQTRHPPFLFLTEAIKWQTNSFIALPNLSISPFSRVTAGPPWPSVALRVSRLPSQWYSPLEHNRGADRGQRVFPKGKGTLIGGWSKGAFCSLPRWKDGWLNLWGQRSFSLYYATHF